MCLDIIFLLEGGLLICLSFLASSSSYYVDRLGWSRSILLLVCLWLTLPRAEGLTPKVFSYLYHKLGPRLAGLEAVRIGLFYCLLIDSLFEEESELEEV